MANKDGYLVLIVGCGQLGSRHLQAVATLPQVRAVELVDPRPEALSLGRQRLDETEGRQTSTPFRWLPSLEQATPGGDLCIVATQTPGRCQLVQEVVQTLGYSSFLLEKLVGQSITEVEDLTDFFNGRGLKAWVDCQTRTFAIHRQMKKRLDPSEPVSLSVIGSNLGLTNNGIHHADLFAFFDGSDRIMSGGSRVDPILHPSKRNSELFDLTGTLHGSTGKGSNLSISYAPGHLQWEHLTVSSSSFRYIVDHLQKTVFESDADSGWAWRQVSFEGSTLVSQMTKEFATNILSTGQCALPTLEQSLVAHRFILGELKPHFSQLMERSIELCPIA